MIGPIVLVSAAVFIAVVVASMTSTGRGPRLSRRRRRLEAWTEGWPLTVRPGSDRAEGEVDGLQVTVDGFRAFPSLRSWHRVRVTLPQRLPAGLRIRPRRLGASVGRLLTDSTIDTGHRTIDERLVVTASSDVDARHFFRSPDVAGALLAVRGTHDTVTDSHITLCHPGRDTRDLNHLVARAIDLAHALGGARLPDLAALARSTRAGLTDVHVDDSGLRLDGLRGDHDLEVTLDPRAGTTTLCVQCPPGLPRDLRVHRGTSDLDHPILDRMVRATGDNQPILRDLLGHEDTVEDVLTVLHGVPGSVLTRESLVVTLPGVLPPDTEDRIDDALRLVEALAQRLQARAKPRSGEPVSERDR